MAQQSSTMTVTFDRAGVSAMQKLTAANERLARAVEEQNRLKKRKLQSGNPEQVMYDESTMQKVWDAIRNTELHNDTRMTGDEATAIISSIQNAGILFRERA